MVRRCQSQIGFHFLVDIDQTGRWSHSGLYGETESVGLSGAVVGILTQNHHFHFIEGGPIQCRENLLARGKDSLSLLFLPEKKSAQIGHVGFFKFIGHKGQPAFVELYFSVHDNKLSRLEGFCFRDGEISIKSFQTVKKFYLELDFATVLCRVGI